LWCDNGDDHHNRPTLVCGGHHVVICWIVVADTSHCKPLSALQPYSDSVSVFSSSVPVSMSIILIVFTALFPQIKVPLYFCPLTLPVTNRFSKLFHRQT